MTSLLQFYFLKSYKTRDVGSTHSALAIRIFVTVAIAVLTRGFCLKKPANQQHPAQLRLLRACCCFPSGEGCWFLEHSGVCFCPGKFSFQTDTIGGLCGLVPGGEGSLSSSLCCWDERMFSALASLGLSSCRSEVLLVHRVDSEEPFAVCSLEMALCLHGTLTSRVTRFNRGVASGRPRAASCLGL